MAGLARDSIPDCTSDYVYEPLDEPQSFRLIRILAAPESSQNIHCTIQKFERGSTECPPYTALSYVWGDASERRPATLNGQQAFVTTNLHQALWNLRTVFPDVYFWIDALSIDQSNVGERGHHVNQMKAIYSDAQEVVAWLGPGVESTGTLFDFVRRHDNDCIASDGSWWHYKVPGGVGIGHAIKDLESNAYWGRIWVIQELVSAASVRLMCGKHVIMWPKIVRFLKHAKRGHFAWEPGENYRRFEVPNQESYIITLSEWPQSKVTLAAALYRTKFSLATDYRDKVFAILGIVDAGAGTRIDADYALSPCNVICEAIQAVAEDEKAIVFEGPLRCRRAIKYFNRRCKYAEKFEKMKPRESKMPGWLEFAALH